VLVQVDLDHIVRYQDLPPFGMQSQ
jgi:hypothetical protein